MLLDKLKGIKSDKSTRREIELVEYLIDYVKYQDKSNEKTEKNHTKTTKLI